MPHISSGDGRSSLVFYIPNELLVSRESRDIGVITRKSKGSPNQNIVISYLCLQFLREGLAVYPLGCGCECGGRSIAPIASAPSRSPRPENGYVGKAHRALYIPEILEVIVRFLDPASVLALRPVAFALQATVSVVLGSQYRHPHPCGPIEYNERLPSGLDWMRSTKGQIEKLKKNVHPGPRQPSVSRCCWMAQLTQAECVPEATLIAARQIWNDEHAFGNLCPRLSLDPLERRWLDLSQTDINPYLMHLFDDRIRKKNGRLEIDPLHSENLLTHSPLIKQRSLASLIRPMFATGPPCKGLGIYMCLESIRGQELWDLGRLQHIRADDGIRIRQLVDALTQCSPDAVANWKGVVRDQRWLFAQMDWTELSLGPGRRHRRCGMRGCEIRPKLIILLDSPISQDHHRCFTECHYSMERNAMQTGKEWNAAFAQADAETRPI